jgi:hypothetical protein
METKIQNQSCGCSEMFEITNECHVNKFLSLRQAELPASRQAGFWHLFVDETLIPSTRDRVTSYRQLNVDRILVL